MTYIILCDGRGLQQLGFHQDILLRSDAFNLATSINRKLEHRLQYISVMVVIYMIVQIVRLRTQDYQKRSSHVTRVSL